MRTTALLYVIVRPSKDDYYLLPVNETLDVTELELLRPQRLI